MLIYKCVYMNPIRGDIVINERIIHTNFESSVDISTANLSSAVGFPSMMRQIYVT